MAKAVEIINARKVFGTLIANDNINFDVAYGEVHALIGENGAGKTTLMRSLYGMYALDGGQILVDGRPLSGSVKESISAGVAMVHQNFMQIPNMSLLENIILGHEPRNRLGVVRYAQAREAIAQLCQKLRMKVNPDQILRTLSIGERQKIEIIKALYLGARIIIFDEPTAVLTPQESEELFEIIRELKREGKAIIYISHKLNEVIAIADRTTVMRKGQVVAKWDSMETVDRHQLAAAMVGRNDFRMIMGLRTGSQGERILSVEHLYYYNVAEKIPLIRDLNFSVRAGEILGIGGVEGNGQQELIQLLIGSARQNHGTITLCGTDVSQSSTRQRREVGLGYISEDRMLSGLSLESTLQENYICGQETRPPFSKFGILNRQAIDNDFTKTVEEYDIYGVRLGAAAKTLSGGNLQKVILAREIKQGPKLLIAAHPTRGLDIGAINFVRQQLNEAKKSGMGVLLITADLEELMALSDRILVMYEGAFSGEILDTQHVTETEIGLYMGGVRQNESGGFQ